MSTATTFNALTADINLKIATARIDRDACQDRIRRTIAAFDRVGSENSKALAKILDQAYQQLDKGYASQFDWKRLALWAGQVQLGWI